MKILKYVKTRNNIYKVYLEEQEINLYDDIIIKYNLLSLKEIDDNILDKIIKDNNLTDYYYQAIKYINKRLRSEKEIREYLKKRNTSLNDIENIIKKLYDNHFLNEELFTDAYIKDAINLGNDGPKKIFKKLENLGISTDLITDALSKIDNEVWEYKIDKYVSKKINNNHTSSKYSLKNKITIDLINLGYDKELITSIINKYDIIDDEVFHHEYEKAKRLLEHKYSGRELEQKIKERLYRKGFHNFNLGDEYYEE